MGLEPNTSSSWFQYREKRGDWQVNFIGFSCFNDHEKRTRRLDAFSYLAQWINSNFKGPAWWISWNFTQLFPGGTIHQASSAYKRCSLLVAPRPCPPPVPLAGWLPTVKNPQNKNLRKVGL